MTEVISHEFRTVRVSNSYQLERRRFISFESKSSETYQFQPEIRDEQLVLLVL